MCLAICKLELAKLATIYNVKKDSNYLSIIEKNNTPKILECGTKIHATLIIFMLSYCVESAISLQRIKQFVNYSIAKKILVNVYNFLFKNSLYYRY